MPGKVAYPLLQARAKWFAGLWLTTSLLTGCLQLILHRHLPWPILVSRTLLAPVWLLLTPLLLGIVYEDWEPARFLYGGILLGLLAWRTGRIFADTKNQPGNAS
jgi:hypothetical protein